MANDSIMDILVVDLIQYIGSQLNLSDLLKFIICNKNIYRTFNNSFWRSKFIKDYYHPGSIEIDDWKSFYLNHCQLYIMGQYDNLPKKTDIKTRDIHPGKYNFMYTDLHGRLYYVTDSFCKLAIRGDIKSASTWLNFSYAVDDMGDGYMYNSSETHPLQSGLTKIYAVHNVNDINYYYIDRQHKLWYNCRNINTVISSNVKCIAVGNLYIIIQDLQDSVYIHGSLENALGMTDAPMTGKTLLLPNIVASSISCGQSNIAIIDKNNELYVAGNNLYGQLGLGYMSEVVRLTKVPDIRCRQIALGNDFAAIIDMDYNVLYSGDFGRATCKFQMIPGIKATSIACTHNRLLIIGYHYA